jgi:hypothetical protein
MRTSSLVGTARTHACLRGAPIKERKKKWPCDDVTLDFQSSFVFHAILKEMTSGIHLCIQKKDPAR